jgi:carboxyl-terminal processing protease
MSERPNNRAALIAVLVFLAPVLLLAGLWLGGHPEHLPGFLKKAFVANHSTLVVDEAIDRVASDYYRPIPVSALSDASITGIVKSLGDRFSHYLTASEFREFDSPPHFAGIGVIVNPLHRGLLIARVFDSSPAARAGLTDGELIVGVGGRKLSGLSSEASTALIRGQPGTDVVLQIESAGAGHRHIRTVRITRELVSEPVVASATRTVKSIKLGVVALAEFSPGAHGEVREAVERLLREKARGIVFDLRGNGGGLVAEAQLIASIFLAKGQTIVTTRGRTQPSNTLLALGDEIPASIPVVVLVDSGTASASEIVTAALQDNHRATVVGTHTFGKGVFQEEEPLSNGGVLDITVGEYFTPNGRNLGGGGVKQGAGITPEVRVSSQDVDTPKGLSIALATLAAKVR